MTYDHFAHVLPEAWTIDDFKTLTGKMHGSLVERDERIWSKSLEAINWEDIKFGHFTAEDCKMTWNVLHNQVRHI